MKELDSKRVAEGGNKSLTDDQCMRLRLSEES